MRSGDQGLIEEAARLEDEMHAVTMRIERVLAFPGARLGHMSIEIPTASARGASAELVLALLGFAAERLAVLLESLQVDDWHIRGVLGSGTVSVYELACMPLHTSARGRRGHAVDHVPRLTRGVGATP